jgi:hypothetical protein
MRRPGRLPSTTWTASRLPARTTHRGNDASASRATRHRATPRRALQPHGLGQRDQRMISSYGSCPALTPPGLRTSPLTPTSGSDSAARSTWRPLSSDPTTMSVHASELSLPDPGPNDGHRRIPSAREPRDVGGGHPKATETAAALDCWFSRWVSRKCGVLRFDCHHVTNGWSGSRAQTPARSTGSSDVNCESSRREARRPVGRRADK